MRFKKDAHHVFFFFRPYLCFVCCQVLAICSTDQYRQHHPSQNSLRWGRQSPFRCGVRNPVMPCLKHNNRCSKWDFINRSNSHWLRLKIVAWLRKSTPKRFDDTYCQATCSLIDPAFSLHITPPARMRLFNSSLHQDDFDNMFRGESSEIPKLGVGGGRSKFYPIFYTNFQWTI